MTVAVPSRQIRAPADTARLMRSLRRRSLVIQFWRGALPALIVVMLGILIVWAGAATLAEMTPQRAAGEIRMLNPEFHGRSKDGRPYTVTAQSAIRDSLHAERSTMIEPRLVMETADRGGMRVSARGGAYNETTKILELWGGVVVDDDKGEHFESPTARVDTTAHTAEGHNGVVASSAMGQVRATSYAMDNRTGHVLLTGGVHTRLVPQRSR